MTQEDRGYLEELVKLSSYLVVVPLRPDALLLTLLTCLAGRCYYPRQWKTVI